MPSFGESGGPCLVAPDHQPACIMGYRTPIGSITLHFGGDGTIAPVAQYTMCRRHHYRLVPWGPRAHPSWTSRNPSIRSCGQSELSRMEQRQLHVPLPLLTSCRSLRWMARCCHQHPLTSPSTFVRHCRGWTCPRQCAVSVLDSFSTSSSHSCGGLDRPQPC